MSLVITSSPSQTRAIFDTQPNFIKATSSNGSDHYIRVEIQEGSNTFTESWSKINDTDVVINMQDLFRNLYNHSYSNITTTGFHEVPALLKTAQITINEYAHSDDSLVQSVDAGTYFVHKAIKRIPISEQSNILTRFLGAIPDDTFFTKGDVIRLPIYVAKHPILDNIEVSIIVTAGNYTLLNITQVLEGNKNYYAVINTSDLANTHRKGINIKIETARISLSRKLNLTTNATYQKHNLVFMNNYGYYQHAYLFGLREDSNSYRRLDYELEDETYITSEVINTKQVTVNTGNLPQTAAGLIDAICTSTDIRLKINGRFVPCQFLTRRSNTRESRNYVYNEDLVFSFKPHQL